jgi:hypothetical protein
MEETMAKPRHTTAGAPKAAAARLDVNSKVKALMRAQESTRSGGDAKMAIYTGAKGVVEVRTGAQWTFKPVAGEPVSGKGAKALAAALG